MEERLVDLEIRYTYLERQLAELNEVVVEQRQTIDGLQTLLNALRARVAELDESPRNERPPHY
jgi:uncharacterized coiled-coil protein SlyX